MTLKEVGHEGWYHWRRPRRSGLPILLSIPRWDYVGCRPGCGAPAMIRARKQEYKKQMILFPLDAEDLHMVIEVTGLDRVKELIYANKPDHVLVMEAEETNC